MKQLIVTLLMGIGILCVISKANANEFKEHVSREFSVSANTSGTMLFIYNISGFIKVEGYAGNKVLLEMDKTISANDDKTIETGKKEFRLSFDQKSDTVMAYIASPYDSRPGRTWQHGENQRDIEYSYKVNFTVKVPFGSSIHISTVNDGVITVENVYGSLHISNVNEGIQVKNAKGTTYAHTVNGDVSVNYFSNPVEASSYNTINGDIRVSYHPDFSADLTFKSMHGDFFTDFSDVKLLPALASKVQDKKGGETVYKLSTITTLRFGKGGKTFKFETLNGNVYIKKQL